MLQVKLYLPISSVLHADVFQLKLNCISEATLSSNLFNFSYHVDDSVLSVIIRQIKPLNICDIQFNL